MARPNLDDFSRFSKTQVVFVEGNETFGRWVPYSFLEQRPAEEDIGVFQVTTATEGRPDLISNALYGTPLLDWVLIAFNNATEVLNWPRTGDNIEYPLQNVVFPEIV